MALIYGSSMTNPNYANYQGSQTWAPRSVPEQIPYQGTNGQVGGVPFIGTGSNTPSPTSSPTAPAGFDPTKDDINAPQWSGLREERARQDVLNAENRVRSDINSGYDSYFSELDKMIGNIPGQQAGQEQIVSNNYNQGVSELQGQKESSQLDLNTSRRKAGEQQVKSLQDIADNIRNLFQTGNVMLGTRGAGDSSAANQYSYAVTKLGSKERGNVMSQTRSIENDIADREAKLNNVVTQETGRLKTERDNKVIEIAQYFQDAQNQLLQAKANGQLQKGQSLAQLSTQLLQNAQQQLMQEDANFKNRQNALLSWATSNASTIGQLKTNLANIGQYNVPGLQTNSLNGQTNFDAQGNLTTNFFSQNNTEKTPTGLQQLGGMLNSTR